MLLAAFEFRHQCLHCLFGVPKDHPGIIIIEQFILDARKTSGHGAFQYKNGLGLIRVYDGHAVDGA